MSSSAAAHHSHSHSPTASSSHSHSHSHSPPSATTTTTAARREPPRKRNRAALSCVACRERKIKCDRMVPCNQCTKRGDAELCFLDPSKRGPPPGQSKSMKVQEQIARQDEMMAKRGRGGGEAGTAAQHPHSADEWTAVNQRLAQLEAAFAARGESGASPSSSSSSWRPWASATAAEAAAAPRPNPDPSASASGSPVPIARTAAAALIKSGPDSDTEDAAMVLEGLAMSGGQGAAQVKRGKCGGSGATAIDAADPDGETDPVKSEPRHSFAAYAAQNQHRDIMLPVSQGGTSGLSAADVVKEMKRTCMNKEGKNGDDEEKTYADLLALEAQGVDVSPADKVCTLLSSSTSLFRPIYGPESFLGFGMGWAFPAAEAAGDLHVKGGECPGSAQREAVLRAIIRSLPRKQLAEQLVSVYADRVNFLAGNVVHMPSFRREVESFYALESVERQARVVNNVDVGWLAVYLLVLTLALRFYPCEPPAHWASIAHYFDGRCVHLWASAARTCLGLARYQSSQSLAVLQSILLANLSDSHAGRKVNQTMLRIAISNAHSMSLHRLGDRSQQPKAGESQGVALRREMAKRIWYQLVFKDWSCSLCSNVYVIQERQFNTPLPGNYNDEDLERSPLPAPRPREEHTDMSYSLEAFEVVKASKLHADVLNDKWLESGESRGRAKLSCSEASRVDAAYRAVLEGLPSFYAVGSEHGTKTNVEIERWLLQQMIFHHILKLHRPALSSQPKARVSCVALARSILDTQKKLRGTCTVIDRLLCNLAQSYTAAIVLLLDLLQHGREHNPAMRLIIRSEVAEALRALHHVNESNNSTEGGIRVIEALLAEEEKRYQAAQAEEDAQFAGAGGKRKRGDVAAPPKKKELLSLALQIAKAAKCEAAGSFRSGSGSGACTSQQEQVERDQRAAQEQMARQNAMLLDATPTSSSADAPSFFPPQQEMAKDALSRSLMLQLFNPPANLALGGAGGSNPQYYNNLFGGAFGGAGGSESGLLHSSMVGPNGVEAELSPTEGDWAGFDLGAWLNQFGGTEGGQGASPSGSVSSNGRVVNGAGGNGGSSAAGSVWSSDESSSGTSSSALATSHTSSDAGSPMLHRKASELSGNGAGLSPPVRHDSASSSSSSGAAPTHHHNSDATQQGLDAFYSWVLSQGLNMRGAGAEQPRVGNGTPLLDQSAAPASSMPSTSGGPSLAPVPPQALAPSSLTSSGPLAQWQPPFGGPPSQGWNVTSPDTSLPPSSGLTPTSSAALPNVGTPSAGANAGSAHGAGAGFGSMFGAAAGADPSWLANDPSSVAAWLSMPGLLDWGGGAGAAAGQGQGQGEGRS